MVKSNWKSLSAAAHTKLSEYITALCAGRSETSDELDRLYLERLAAAAQLTTLMSGISNVDRIREVIRDENRAFPRAFLSTDAGRAARGAFNALARAANALEEFKSKSETRPSGPKLILATKLSSVAFIWDYVQLEFSGRGFNVFCPIELRGTERSIRSEDPGFRDKLCELIGQTVRNIDDSGTFIEIDLDCHAIKFPSRLESSLETFTFFDTDV